MTGSADPAPVQPPDPARSTGRPGAAGDAGGTAAAGVAHGHFDAALQAARSSHDDGGVPIGAALVRDGKLIAVGHNRRVQDGDATAHAEIDCLRNAGRQTDYGSATLFSTLAPCAMCTGAIIQFGIPRVIVGEAANFPGELELLRSRGVEVTVLDDERATSMMSGFIRDNSRLWNEDIGVAG